MRINKPLKSGIISITRAVFLLYLIASLLCPPMIYADYIQADESLKNISSFFVRVDVSSEIEPYISRSRIKTDVELKLKSFNINVITDQQRNLGVEGRLKNDTLRNFRYIDITIEGIVQKEDWGDRIFYLISFNINQSVILYSYFIDKFYLECDTKEKPKWLYCPTWEKIHYGYCSNSKFKNIIRETAKEMCDDLINGYLQYNPVKQ